VRCRTQPVVAEAPRGGGGGWAPPAAPGVGTQSAHTLSASAAPRHAAPPLRRAFGRRCFLLRKHAIHYDVTNGFEVPRPSPAASWRPRGFTTWGKRSDF